MPSHQLFFLFGLCFKHLLLDLFNGEMFAVFRFSCIGFTHHQGRQDKQRIAASKHRLQERGYIYFFLFFLLNFLMFLFRSGNQLFSCRRFATFKSLQIFSKHDIFFCPDSHILIASCLLCSPSDSLSLTLFKGHVTSV